MKYIMLILVLLVMGCAGLEIKHKIPQTTKTISGNIANAIKLADLVSPGQMIKTNSLSIISLLDNELQGTTKTISLVDVFLKIEQDLKGIHGIPTPTITIVADAFIDNFGDIELSIKGESANNLTRLKKIVSLVRERLEK